MPDRYRRADDEQADRAKQRPHVFLAAVAEGASGIGRPDAAPIGDQQEHFIAGVGPGMCGLGQHRRRPRYRSGGRLGGRDREVRTERYEYGECAFTAGLDHGELVAATELLDPVRRNPVGGTRNGLVLRMTFRCSELWPVVVLVGVVVPEPVLGRFERPDDGTPGFAPVR